MSNQKSTLSVDGSQGEGGGQILRSCLGLSLVTGRPFVIENIRRRRSKPGLLRQHLTAVEAAARISGGRAGGAAIGSTHLRFEPGALRPGSYSFSVGTAGSTTLVLQALLPALVVAKGEIRLRLEGGTHNPSAPPFDFLALSYLPLVERLGPGIEVELQRPGFFPEGGGSFTARVTPSRGLGPLELMDRGRLIERRVRALVANLPLHIARRECEEIRKKTGWPEKCFQATSVPGVRGPGNVVLIEVRHESVTEVFAGFGKKGIPAERVAASALREAQRYLRAGVPVGPHLADQLVVPLAVGAWQGRGGGRFRTVELTGHARSQVEIVRAFLDVEVVVETRGPEDVLVTVGG